MRRAVLDTNVLASAVAHPRGTPGLIVAAWERTAFELVVSEYILTELAVVLERPYFVANAPREWRVNGLSRFRRRGTITTLTVLVRGVAPDPADDAILATAASANAEYLVTGDKPLLTVGGYGGTAIVSPRAFLDLLLAGLL